MPTLIEAGQDYKAALQKYNEAYNAFPVKKLADGTEARDIPANDLKTLGDMLAEVDAKGETFRTLRETEEKSERARKEFDELSKTRREAAPKDTDGDAETKPQKTLGQLFVESKIFKGGQPMKGVEAEVDANVKTLMQTSTGWTPESVRSGRVVLSAQRPPQVVDLIPSGSISQVANVYMRETTFTNNAAEVAEGNAFGEAALALAEVTDPVVKVAILLPVTDEQLADIPRITAYIDNRLDLMIRQRLDNQLLNGNGTSPNMRGILNVAGIQTQARGSDAPFDTWLKLLTKLIDTPGFCTPSGLVMNPTDWTNLRLQKTADGVYILGNPGDSGRQQLWGQPVAQTSVLTAGTGIAGDWLAYSDLLYYQGIEFKITDSNADDFTKGKQMLRATIRVCPSWYRATAFGTATGLN